MPRCAIGVCLLHPIPRELAIVDEKAEPGLQTTVAVARVWHGVTRTSFSLALPLQRKALRALIFFRLTTTIYAPSASLSISLVVPFRSLVSRGGKMTQAQPLPSNVEHDQDPRAAFPNLEDYLVVKAVCCVDYKVALHRATNLELKGCAKYISEWPNMRVIDQWKLGEPKDRTQAVIETAVRCVPSSRIHPAVAPSISVLIRAHATA